jgi:hypothetical protein
VIPVPSEEPALLPPHDGVLINYLILAHEQPQQLARLLHRLLSGTADTAVVHVDRTSDQTPFEREARHLGDRVRFVERRQNVRWGGFSMCRATLEAMRIGVELGQDYQVLVSGADYPIRPVSELRAELASGAIYLDSRPLPVPEWEMPLTRLSRFGFVLKNRRSRLRHVIYSALQVFPPRNVAKGLGGRRPYGGFQWWAFPQAVATSVLGFADRERSFVRFYSRSSLPDESFFHTIVAAEHPGHPVRHSLTWADWGREAKVQPAVLGSADLPLLAEAARDGYFFARKFDWLADRDVYDLIDRDLLPGPSEAGRP